MQHFWVIGGEYKDTSFQKLVAGQEEWIGPFESFEQAEKEWAKRAWATVDHATIRYRIEALDPGEAPPKND